MTRQPTLSLTDIIYRTARYSPEDLQPLVKYTGFDIKGKDLRARSTAEEFDAHIRRVGSNDIASAFRRGDGVPYLEVAYDAAKFVKAPDVKKEWLVEDVEEAVVRKKFGDLLDVMSPDERRALFQSMDIPTININFAALSPALMQVLLQQFGGFATYRFAVIMANIVSRSLLSSGLSFAGNIAVTRTVGTLLGPIGWIATGAWLAVDLAGPAMRKTVPAVLYIAMLRQMLQNRASIGVVGDGSVGKDALIKDVLKTEAQPDPVAGSTFSMTVYPLGSSGTAEIINYPGFNDYSATVNRLTDERLRHTDVFILVVDATRGISGTDVKILENLKQLGGHPILVCLNKWDALRNDADREKILGAARTRLGKELDFIPCSFDPLDGRELPSSGRAEVLQWIFSQLEKLGKQSIVDFMRKELS